MVVKFNLWNNASRNRKYPEIKENHEVRILLEKETGKKGYMPKWSKEVYKVIGIRNGDFLVNDGKRKVYQRHELLKV